MARPVILTVDDDPDVLRAVERDLRSRYGQRYRIVRAESGLVALELLRRLDRQNEAVALMLVDHRMPQMNGIETLTAAMKIFPGAKRVLLTAYADTEAAIRAINEVQLNHYLLKPWDPPDQHLYPVLDDLLEDWRAHHRPPFEGVRVLGSRWSQKSYEVRDFLARNQIPYRWLDVETADQDPAVRKALDSVVEEDRRLPVILLANGECLPQPDLNLLADKLGLQTRAVAEFYDLAIVGGGPAGLAAAVYGASEGLKTVILEGEAPGGQAGLSSRIENYLGFPSGLSGADLARRAVTQAKRFGVEILSPVRVSSIKVEGPYKFLEFGNGSRISCHAVVLATGVQWRKLDVPGMDRLQDAGVYYGAAATEALSCRDEDIYIVGGANSAGQAAMFFSKYARRVIMLVRGPSLAATMSQYLIDQIGQTANIHVEVHTRVVEVHGEDRLQAISLYCEQSGETSRVDASALFIFIGARPQTEWLDGSVMRDANGFVLTGSDLMTLGKPPKGWTEDRDPYLLETSLPGVFAAGDVRRGSAKRVASGVGEGSVAVQFVHQYLSKAGELKMAENPTLEDLRSIDVFKDLAEADLEWLSAHMEIQEGKAGDLVIRAGDPADYLIAIFSGELRGMRPGSDQVYVASAGSVTGVLPYSRLTHYPSEVHASRDTRAGRMHKRHFPEMLQQVPVLPPRLVALMADRIRESTRADNQREKLMALGQLSAGLAHELNNPAAAAQRAADYLKKTVRVFRDSSVKMALLDLPMDARAFLIQLESDLADKTDPLTTMDSLDRSDREESLVEWLEEHKVTDAWSLAADLVDADCTQATLDRVADIVPAKHLDLILRRLTASVTVSRLVDEIDNSMKRISELVRAVKDYSYMDQMPEQEVDIHDGIETTLIMLKHRLKNGVEVVREYDREIPRMIVRGRELNQVWTNLITNAIDAMEGKGQLRIATKCSDGRVLVEVADNGSGIPPEIRDRIFEPFFTTKGVNEGTGLGLDIAARVVRNHGGSIEVESKPGHTVFGVRLPLECAHKNGDGG